MTLKCAAPEHVGFKATVVFEVWDKDKIGKGDFLGEATIVLRGNRAPEQMKEHTLPVMLNGQQSGEITVEFSVQQLAIADGDKDEKTKLKDAKKRAKQARKVARKGICKLDMQRLTDRIPMNKKHSEHMVLR